MAHNGRLDGRRQFAWAMRRVGYRAEFIAEFLGISIQTVWRDIRAYEGRL